MLVNKLMVFHFERPLNLHPKFNQLIDSEYYGNKINNALQYVSNRKLEDVLHFLANGYCENCGVSYGYRSVYWSLLAESICDYFPDFLSTTNGEKLSYGTGAAEFIKLRIENAEDYLAYDAGLNLEETLEEALELINSGEIDIEYLNEFIQLLCLFCRLEN